MKKKNEKKEKKSYSVLELLQLDPITGLKIRPPQRAFLKVGLREPLDCFFFMWGSDLMRGILSVGVKGGGEGLHGMGYWNEPAGDVE